MRRMVIGVALGAAALALGTGAPAHAQDFQAQLRGFQEPPPVSTSGTGTFDATITPGQIEYELTYDNLEGEIAQAHIHFGQVGVNGGISAFLCTNLANGPAGTQTCPDSPGRVTGVIQSADVVGPAPQGIEPGQFGELVRAIRAGITYANVHTDIFPMGEIRGQIRRVPAGAGQ